MSKAQNWTREEEIIVFNLYCKIPFKKSSKNHPEVIKIANLLGRSPSAVNMKIGNFGSFDDNLKKQCIVGLKNASKLDKEIWDEFNNNWDELSFESEQLIFKLSTKDNHETELPKGKEKIVIAKQRINQDFFRNSVLASYNEHCCITGLSSKSLLIASHIKPWKDSTEDEKANPTNGLCLNALHDKAFDRGFITIDKRYIIHISYEIISMNNEPEMLYFKKYDGQQIILPDKFLPNKDFLEYHNDVIFENWRKR